MAFGDWELFRMVIISLREMEASSFTYDEGSRSVRFTVESEQNLRKGIFEIYSIVSTFLINLLTRLINSLIRRSHLAE